MRRAALALALSLVSGCPDSHDFTTDARIDAPPIGACGPVVCPTGTFCCNASCGICVPPGGGCIELACVDAGGACAPQDARPEGPCEAELGVMWTGWGCRTISGCTCVGADCGSLYESVDACVAAHPSCPRSCGGWGGEVCLAGELCDYPEGSFCGGDDSTGVCVPRPTECPEPGGVPVCGCDGRDYLTECTAHLSGVDVLRLGECERPPVESFRSARMYGECGIAGGLLSHVVLADVVPSCTAELPRYLDVTLLRNLDLLPGPTTFDLGPGSVEGRATLCDDGVAGLACVPAHGTFTVHHYATGDGARFDYDLTADDGRRVAASDLDLRGQFCPFVDPGCR